MDFQKFGPTFVLRLDAGEEVIGTIARFCEKQRVFAGHFSGIGSAKSACLSTFDVSKKKYADRVFAGQLEIVSLCGNVAIMDGQVIVHCHAVLGKTDFSAVAGHLKSAVVSATCEVFLQELSGKLEKRKSEKTMLNVFFFSK